MSEAPLAKSAEKQLLFRRLGLTDQVHEMLLQEAHEGRDRLSQNPDGLTPQSLADPKVNKPYKWDELSETAKHLEILAIVNKASEFTKPYYLKGKFTTCVAEENWVARWYLWHSFRYRDNNSNKRRAPVRAGQASEATSRSQAKYYDAVYDTYR